MTEEEIFHLSAEDLERVQAGIGKSNPRVVEADRVVVSAEDDDARWIDGVAIAVNLEGGHAEALEEAPRFRRSRGPFVSAHPAVPAVSGDSRRPEVLVARVLHHAPVHAH